MKEPENPIRNITWIMYKMENTTGPEQDFWYDRYYDLYSEAIDAEYEARLVMNGGDSHE